MVALRPRWLGAPGSGCERVRPGGPGTGRRRVAGRRRDRRVTTNGMIARRRPAGRAIRPHRPTADVPESRATVGPSAPSPRRPAPARRGLRPSRPGGRSLGTAPGGNQGRWMTSPRRGPQARRRGRSARGNRQPSQVRFPSRPDLVRHETHYRTPGSPMAAVGLPCPAVRHHPVGRPRPEPREIQLRWSGSLACSPTSYNAPTASQPDRGK